MEKPADGQSTKERVQVSLTDCLACSGCVTSAETVLISQQSHEEFLNLLTRKQENKSAVDRLTVVVSLSHQVIASFAARHQTGFDEAADRIASFLKSLGVDFVFDLTLARHLSIIEAGREFVQVWSDRESEDVGVKKLPILSTVCPGWVCYAEKTHGNLVPLLSQVKSPQQIMGSIVKTVWCRAQGIGGPVHHVTIMPCFDKKLEASRSNFIDGQTGEKDVDSVLTPIELQQMLDSREISFLGIPVLSAAVDVLHPLSRRRSQGEGGDQSQSNGQDRNSSSRILSHYGSGSGGHAENVLVYASRQLLHQQSIVPSDIKYETRRNSDFLEIQVSAPGLPNHRLLFAIVNGFRNIQTLVQKVKRKKCEYDFIEVMACPSGCLNGGAQLKPSTSEPAAMDADEFSARIRQVYRSLETLGLPFDASQDPIRSLYEQWFPTDEIRKRMLYTEFKAVPKTENLLTMTW